jgi:PadR family transcriptional regulator, regulatory protein PadR
VPVTRREAEALLPLSPATMAILLALVEEAQHGYAILKAVEAQAHGPRLGTGTLYAALQRLTQEGVIEESAGRPGEDARRRHYRLTRYGRSVVRAEALRLARVVAVAQSKSLLPGLRLTGLPPLARGA